MADEIYELRDELNVLQRHLQDAQAGLPIQQQTGPSVEEEAIIVQAIDHLAGKIERIAGRIHGSEAA